MLDKSTKQKLFVTVISSLCLFQSSHPQSFKQNIETDTSEIDLIKEADSIVANKMTQYNIPGLSIGIIRNDSIIYAKGCGVKSIGKSSLVKENTIFHTASISKLFTAQAIIKLTEQKIISIDDALIEILPDLNYQDERIGQVTIKTLLNHTSGLPDIRNCHWNHGNQSDNSLKKYIMDRNIKLDSDPCSVYSYSNLSYDILGYVIEKVMSTTFDDFMKEHILNKSEMHDSDFRYFKIPDSLRAMPHSKHWITRKIYTRKIYPYTREHAPSSTLNSSSKDLCKWMISFLQTLSDPEFGNVYSTMTQPTFSSYPNVGLGFQIGSINSQKTIGHYGGNRGFRSYLVMIPKEKIGLVLLANCDHEENFRQQILHPIGKLMLTRYKEH